MFSFETALLQLLHTLKSGGFLLKHISYHMHRLFYQQIAHPESEEIEKW